MIIAMSNVRVEGICTFYFLKSLLRYRPTKSTSPFWSFTTAKHFILVSRDWVIALRFNIWRSINALFWKNVSKEMTGVPSLLMFPQSQLMMLGLQTGVLTHHISMRGPQLLKNTTEDNIVEQTKHGDLDKDGDLDSESPPKDTNVLTKSKVFANSMMRGVFSLVLVIQSAAFIWIG